MVPSYLNATHVAWNTSLPAPTPHHIRGSLSFSFFSISGKRQSHCKRSKNMAFESRKRRCEKCGAMQETICLKFRGSKFIEFALANNTGKFWKWSDNISRLRENLGCQKNFQILRRISITEFQYTKVVRKVAVHARYKYQKFIRQTKWH